MITPLPLSIFIITKNESDRLPRTLEAIQGLADEIIVVDSGSSDNTCEIAKKYHAKVLVNTPFIGYGQQKRFAEDHCKNDWVLNLDADEEMSPLLYEEIVLLFMHPQKMANFYSLRITDILKGETSPPYFAYTNRVVRLYKRSCGRFNLSPVHDSVITQGKVKTLRAPLHHYSIRSFTHLIDKFTQYSDLQAKTFVMRPRIRSMRLLVEFPFAFCKCYLGRGYIFRGINGYLIAMIYAFYRLLRLVKINEARENNILNRQVEND